MSEPELFDVIELLVELPLVQEKAGRVDRKRVSWNC